MLPTPSQFAHHWAIDPTVCFLNHGSFGGTPRQVLAHQDALRAQMEAETIKFFVEDFFDLMDQARKALATFLHGSWEDFAPIPNATIAVATVLDSLVDAGRIGKGDELLINEHEYPACRAPLRGLRRHRRNSVPLPQPRSRG